MTTALRAALLAGALFPIAAPAAAAPLSRPPGFAMCAVCHKTAAGEKSVLGPNLWRVGGRKSGTAAFPYSPAMKSYGATWTGATLTAFITAPQRVVPGTKMAYAGQKDPAAAAAIVAYVLSLK